MPSNYFKSILKRGIKRSDLIKYWNRAKKAADKSYKKHDSKYWGTVTNIFKNMINKHLNLNEDAITSVPDSGPGLIGGAGAGQGEGNPPITSFDQIYANMKNKGTKSSDIKYVRGALNPIKRAKKHKIANVTFEPTDVDSMYVDYSGKLG